MTKWTKTNGLITATFTPLQENGTVNLTVIEPYAQLLVSQGVKQVYVNATTGEGQSLSVEERKAITETWVKVGRTKLERIIVNVGAGNLIDTKELAKHAATVGVDAIAVIPPTYHKPIHLTELVDYVADAAKAAPNTPVLYYHIPKETGIEIRVTDFVKEAHTKIPTFAGVVFVSADLHDAVTASLLYNGKYDIISGVEGVLLGALSVGLQSFAGASFTLIGKTANRLIRAFEEGNLRAAREEQIRIQEFLNVTHNVGQKLDIATLKAIVPQYFPAVKVGPTRKPITPIAPGQVEDVKAKLEAIRFRDTI